MKSLVTALLLAAAAPLCAQTLKPGLWEVQHRIAGNPEMDRAMEEMREQMAQMPPEQRRQMEAMMARQGVQMGPKGSGMRVCMTREMVERNEVPAHEGDCRTTRQKRSGNTLEVAFACSNPPSSGESRITFTSPEAYSMRTTATTGAGGAQERMTMESQGRWLGSDCGTLRPPGK